MTASALAIRRRLATRISSNFGWSRTITNDRRLRWRVGINQWLYQEWIRARIRVRKYCNSWASGKTKCNSCQLTILCLQKLRFLRFKINKNGDVKVMLVKRASKKQRRIKRADRRRIDCILPTLRKDWTMLINKGGANTICLKGAYHNLVTLKENLLGWFLVLTYLREPSALRSANASRLKWKPLRRKPRESASFRRFTATAINTSTININKIQSRISMKKAEEQRPSITLLITTMPSRE